MMSRIRHTLGWGLVAVVDWYCRRSPWPRGKTGLKTRLAERFPSFGPASIRLRPFRSSGRELALWHQPVASLAVHQWLWGNVDNMDEARLLAPLEKPGGGVFLDIGANCGFYSLFAATRPAAQVIAMEASPDTAELLRRNVKQHSTAITKAGSHIDVVQAACGDHSGQVSFEHCWDDGASSLFKVPQRSGRTVTVPMLTGDDVLEQRNITYVDVCKIDVEGAELAVLRGLTQTLRRRAIGRLRLEINRERCHAAGHEPVELIEFLTAHGYEMTPDSRSDYAEAEWKNQDFYFTPAKA